ncbi:MAG: hypothetical protein U0167_05025 [bacterium]
MRARSLTKVLFLLLGAVLFAAPALATVQRTMLVEEFGWWN